MRIASAAENHLQAPAVTPQQQQQLYVYDIEHFVLAEFIRRNYYIYITQLVPKNIYRHIYILYSFLNRHTTDPALINDISILIDLILTHNLLKFNNDHYLQIKGTAMGNKMAPADANISMDSIETSLFSASPLKPSIYYRYIDDISLIWPHGHIRHMSSM